MKRVIFQHLRNLCIYFWQIPCYKLFNVSRKIEARLKHDIQRTTHIWRKGLNNLTGSVKSIKPNMKTLCLIIVKYFTEVLQCGYHLRFMYVIRLFRIRVSEVNDLHSLLRLLEIYQPMILYCKVCFITIPTILRKSSAKAFSRSCECTPVFNNIPGHTFTQKLKLVISSI